jgi:outer membrane protein
MKKNIYLIAGFTLLLFVMSNNALAADKIGFVNTQEVLAKSNAGKKAVADFKALAEKKSAPVKSLGNELQKMKEDLEKQGSVMSDSARRDKETAFNKKQRDYQVMVQDVNEELKNKQIELFQKLEPDVQKAISKIAKDEKLAAVFVTAPPLTYYAPENDITSKVIDEFNRIKK